MRINAPPLFRALSKMASSSLNICCCRDAYLFDESEVGLTADYISETTPGGVLHVKAKLDLQARDREVFYTAIPDRFLYQTRTNRHSSDYAPRPEIEP